MGYSCMCWPARARASAYNKRMLESVNKIDVFSQSARIKSNDDDGDGDDDESDVPVEHDDDGAEHELTDGRARRSEAAVASELRRASCGAASINDCAAGDNGGVSG